MTDPVEQSERTEPINFKVRLNWNTILIQSPEEAFKYIVWAKL